MEMTVDGSLPHLRQGVPGVNLESTLSPKSRLKISHSRNYETNLLQSIKGATWNGKSSRFTTIQGQGGPYKDESISKISTMAANQLKLAKRMQVLAK